MLRNYAGADIVDGSENRIGTVERMYMDEAGAGRFIQVALDSIPPLRRLVPLDGAELTGRHIRVPFGRERVAGSPDATSVGDMLDAVLLDEVCSFYGMDTPPAARGATSGNPGAVRDLGDVIEIPIVSEELVKRTVVKEVLRIRKTWVTEQQTIETDLRKEDVEVIVEGDVQFGKRDA